MEKLINRYGDCRYGMTCARCYKDENKEGKSSPEGLI